MARFGALDILVNNASITGTPVLASLVECPPSTVDRIVDVNLKGTFYASQAAARWMIAAGRGGSLVHISSVAAYAAQKNASLYSATKAAQISLAQSLALELAPYRIRVNAIAPGDIHTETNAGIHESLNRTGISEGFRRVTPWGRKGTPEEIGRAVAFLVSDEASFVTGAALLVDGGYLTY